MKQLLYIFAFMCIILMSDCSLFDEEDITPFITFEHTLGGGGVDLGIDVIELENSYLVVGEAGPECDIINAVCLMLDKETGLTIQFNNFGRAGQGNEDNFHDVEQIADGTFVAVGFTSAKAAVVPYDTCRTCSVYDEDFVFDTIPPCDAALSTKTNGDLFIAHFDANLTQIGNNEFIASNNSNSRWDAGYSLTIKDNQHYIAGSWGGHISLLVTDVNDFITDYIVSDSFVGEHRDVNIGLNGEIVMTGFAKCFSTLPCSCPSGLPDDEIIVFAKYANGELSEICYPKREGSEVSHGESIIAAKDGGYMIAGFATDSSGEPHILIMKVTDDGTEIWSEPKILFPDKQGKAIHIIPDNNNSDGEEGYILAGDLDGDLFIMKIDLNGNMLWTETYNNLDTPGNNSIQSGKSIIATEDGGFLIVGNSFNSDGSNSTIYVVKTDARGRVR